MNEIYLTEIPLLVAVLIALGWFLFELIPKCRICRTCIAVISFLLIYGLLARHFQTQSISKLILGTILTLLTAFVARCLTLLEVCKQYRKIKSLPDLNGTKVKSIIIRFLEISPDLILILLLFAMPADLKKELPGMGNWIFFMYFVELIYVLLLVAYIIVGDNIAYLHRKGQKTQTR